MIKNNPWDSSILQQKAGLIPEFEDLPGTELLCEYEFVSVRIPTDRLNYIFTYYSLGFSFVTIDFELEKTAAKSKLTNQNIFRISKSKPTFSISGFKVPGSRFELDTKFRERLPRNYWDISIDDHCQTFADFCLCALSAKNELEGVISCFEHPDAIELFLVATRDDIQRQGIGMSLLNHAEMIAHEQQKMLRTFVVAQNANALKFYSNNGFVPRRSYYVMHYWRS